MAALSSKLAKSSTIRQARVSAARVKPFTSARQHLARYVPKAAEAEAEPAPEPAAEVAVEEEAVPEAAAVEDFAFNLHDAKRGNEFAASDVDAALRFYADGQGSMPYNDDFATNAFVATLEDAAFFDDLDNNEGYQDDYAASGIPEAAPRRKRRDDNREGGSSIRGLMHWRMPAP